MARNDLDETTAPAADLAAGGTSRRTVLRGLAAVAVVGGGAAVLSACGSDDAETTTSDSGAGADQAPASDSPADAPSASAEAPAAATELAKLSAVPVGGGLILPDQQLVLTQPTAGEVKAFSSICTHSNCPVTQITGTEIVCPCHGSKFAIADGSVIQGPAEAPLSAVTVAVEGDAIVTA